MGAPRFERPPRQPFALPRPNIGSAAEAERVLGQSRMLIVLGLFFSFICTLGALDRHGDEPVWSFMFKWVFGTSGFLWTIGMGIRDEISARRTLRRGRLEQRGLWWLPYLSVVLGIGILLGLVNQIAYSFFGL
jgi:hypothetical protein